MTTDTSTHSSVKAYLLVFAALAALTGLTVWLSYAGLPHKIAIVAASLIALTKCSLIAAVFMHLKSEGKGIRVMLLLALFFVATLALILIPDIGIIR